MTWLVSQKAHTPMTVCGDCPTLASMAARRSATWSSPSCAQPLWPCAGDVSLPASPLPTSGRSRPVCECGRSTVAACASSTLPAYNVTTRPCARLTRSSLARFRCHSPRCYHTVYIAREHWTITSINACVYNCILPFSKLCVFPYIYHRLAEEILDTSFIAVMFRLQLTWLTVKYHTRQLTLVFLPRPVTSRWLPWASFSSLCMFEKDFCYASVWSTQDSG